jgi:hypothetical protein
MKNPILVKPVRVVTEMDSVTITIVVVNTVTAEIV